MSQATDILNHIPQVQNPKTDSFLLSIVFDNTVKLGNKELFGHPKIVP